MPAPQLSPPPGFGYDFAGVVDEVGDGATGLAVGDRVYGGALGRAAADFVVVKTPTEAPESLFHTPDGLIDEVASTRTGGPGTDAGSRWRDRGDGPFGTETAETALALGVPAERISTYRRGAQPSRRRARDRRQRRPAGCPEQITGAILVGKITVPMAATFPIDQIREAVTLQAGRHAHGKIVITL